MGEGKFKSLGISMCGKKTLYLIHKKTFLEFIGGKSKEEKKGEKEAGKKDDPIEEASEKEGRKFIFFLIEKEGEKNEEIKVIYKKRMENFPVGRILKMAFVYHEKNYKIQDCFLSDNIMVETRLKDLVFERIESSKGTFFYLVILVKIGPRASIEQLPEKIKNVEDNGKKMNEKPVIEESLEGKRIEIRTMGKISNGLLNVLPVLEKDFPFLKINSNWCFLKDNLFKLSNLFKSA